MLLISSTSCIDQQGLTSSFILLFFLDFSSTGVALASRSISLSAVGSACDVDGRARFLLFVALTISELANNASYFALRLSYSDCNA